MSVKNVTEFKNLKVSGIGGIGAEGTRIQKKIGNTFAGNLSFQYQGPGGNFDVGTGFAPAALIGYQDITHQFVTTISLPAVVAPSWGSRTVTVGGIIPSNMALGLKDNLAWIQIAGGFRDPGGNGYIITDGWVTNSYEIIVEAVQQFQTLTAIYA